MKKYQQVHKKCGGSIGIARSSKSWEFFCTQCCISWLAPIMPKLPADFVNVKNGTLIAPKNKSN